MIDKRLMSLVSESKKYIILNVLVRWISLCVNIMIMYAASVTLSSLYRGVSGGYTAVFALMIATGGIAARYMCTRASGRLGFLSSMTVRKALREKIYRKLLKLGSSYDEKVNTSEIVQTAVEGVDQLETYFESYIPQFFYAMLAPLTLFVVTLMIDWRAALVLFICVPLIPVSIVIVQKWAKKLLAKYWGQYTEMGDTFLENLQGLTTLKIYQSDEHQNEVMNEQAEQFRKVTMRVLIMQLNSISVMDLVAWGGAAAGMIVALNHFANGLPLTGMLMIILLSADFFLPMRQLGSFFHVAMNGMAAADRIFAFLELEEDEPGTVTELQGSDISVTDLRFSYEEEREVLKGISFEAGKGITAIVGESGSGKSTIAAILAGHRKHYEGNVTVGSAEVRDIREDILTDTVTYVPSGSYLFKGTVRENLRMGKHDASDEEMKKVLQETELLGFLETRNGLDTELRERGSNLSGGQCQRLALARALLHDTPVYIFDEVTSNIDAESEAAIMARIHELAETRTVILISHRLANVTDAGNILVLENGVCAGQGKHEELMRNCPVYARMYTAQMDLEQFGKDGGHDEEK